MLCSAENISGDKNPESRPLCAGDATIAGTGAKEPCLEEGMEL